MNKFTLLSIATGLGFTALPASAAPPNPFYAPGDLVIAFQKPGDTDTVYASLGNAATLFRGAAAGPGVANNLNFLDLNAVLTSAFGAAWASDPDIYASLAGIYNTSTTSNVLTNGDPARTLYISSPRDSVATLGTADSLGWDLSLAGDTAMDAAATGIQTQNNVFENNYDLQAVVSPTGTSQIDDQNPFLSLSPVIQGNAMADTLEGGIQQAGSATSFGTFGAAGQVEFALDLYRVLARNNISGQIAGVLRVGSFEGTITVSTTGKVSFISQGAVSSAYDTWIGTFNPPLTNASDRLPTTDPDNDGFNNLAEFVLNGNPSVSSQALAPTLDASGSNFVFSFTRRDDSEATAPVVFQYGSDLASWTGVAVGAASGTVGAASVGVTEGGTVTDAITVTIPKTLAVNGKLFGRIMMVK